MQLLVNNHPLAAVSWLEMCGSVNTNVRNCLLASWWSSKYANILNYCVSKMIYEKKKLLGCHYWLLALGIGISHFGMRISHLEFFLYTLKSYFLNFLRLLRINKLLFVQFLIRISKNCAVKATFASYGYIALSCTGRMSYAMSKTSC